MAKNPNNPNNTVNWNNYRSVYEHCVKLQPTVKGNAPTEAACALLCFQLLGCQIECLVEQWQNGVLSFNPSFADCSNEQILLTMKPAPWQHNAKELKVTVTDLDNVAVTFDNKPFAWLMDAINVVICS